MNLADDDPEHAVVVPGGLLAPTEGWFDSCDRRRRGCGGAMAHPTVILAEGNVENPVQGILDVPVPADGPGRDGRIGVAVGEEIADLGLSLTGVVNAVQTRGIRAASDLPKVSEPGSDWFGLVALGFSPTTRHRMPASPRRRKNLLIRFRTVYLRIGSVEMLRM